MQLALTLVVLAEMQQPIALLVVQAHTLLALVETPRLTARRAQPVSTLVVLAVMRQLTALTVVWAPTQQQARHHVSHALQEHTSHRQGSSRASVALRAHTSQPVVEMQVQTVLAVVLVRTSLALVATPL